MIGSLIHQGMHGLLDGQIAGKGYIIGSHPAGDQILVIGRQLLDLRTGGVVHQLQPGSLFYRITLLQQIRRIIGLHPLQNPGCLPEIHLFQILVRAVCVLHDLSQCIHRKQPVKIFSFLQLQIRQNLRNIVGMIILQLFPHDLGRIPAPDNIQYFLLEIFIYFFFHSQPPSFY